MNILTAGTEKKIAEALVSNNMVAAEKLEEARHAAEQAGEPLFSYMVKNGYLTDEQLTKANAIVTNAPYVNLLSARVDPKILALLPQDLAERYMAVPLGETQRQQLVVAMLDAENVQAVDFLSNRLKRPLKVYLASEAGIRQVLKQYDSQLDTSMDSSLVKHLANDNAEAELTAVKSAEAKAIESTVESSPISQALSAILEFAVRNRASDVHIEPMEKVLKVRCRVDGVLREITRLPKNVEPALISRIKILSNLKIDEHRIPQDGQFSVVVDGKSVDTRVAVAPIIWGEQVVIRLLDKTDTSLRLEDMGYIGRTLRTIRSGLQRTNGMILTSGPTGSGKSTSLYALIQEIKNDTINIITLEDPIEYKMEGVNQMQVNPDIGLTFASGLRSILRQDPDVIMVGEIRDKETAQLAVQAALTGHLVFSTLHTNSAAGILPRLLDMGIEPFLIASTVHTVIGQRLVRRVADAGRQTYQSSPAETAAIQATLGRLLPASPEQAEAVARDLGYKNLPLRQQSAYTLTKGTDSPDTPGGYKGRMGLYEVFEVSEAIQALIMKQATSTQIQAAAQAEGMITMSEDGYLKALAGYSTLVEINRVVGEGNA